MMLVRRILLGLALLFPVLCAGASGGFYSQSTGFTDSTPATGNYLGYGAWNANALSDDGKTALVGDGYATLGGNSDSGKVLFYSYTNGAWTETQEIDDPAATASDYFGITVALSGDGQSALIASYGVAATPTNSGVAYLYTLSNGKWTLAHTFDDPNATSDDYFSYGGVALSDDGKTAVITAGYETVNSNTYSGEIYVFSDASGSWQSVFSATDPDAAASDYFGLPAAISADGNSVVVGSDAAVSGATSAGKAYLYTLSNGHWTQAHEFDDPLAAVTDYFGYGGLALSQDGSTAVIGSYGAKQGSTANAGVGYIYKETNGNWGTPTVIIDPDNNTADYFSYPLGVSLDGTKAYFGNEATVGSAAHAGKAYVYALGSSSWSLLKEIDDPKGAQDDYFSYGAALSGDGETLLSSAPYQTVNSLTDAGEVYAYQSQADLALAMSADSSSVTKGKQVALELTVTNNDSVVTANNVIATVTLPTGMNYASTDAANGSCADSGSTVTCTLTSLGPGATWQPAVTVTAAAAGSQAVSASVSSNQPDPVSSNDTASATVKVTAASSSSGSSGSSTGSSGGGGSLGLLVLGMLGGLQAFAGRRRRG